MNILITGAAGYAADAIIENLLRLGHHVCGVDNMLYTNTYMRPDIEFYRVDIRGKEFEAIMMNKWDAIIHCASLVGDGACQANPEETISINEAFVEKLVNIAPEETRLIFPSSCSVYGANNKLLDENSPTNPLSLYAGTKLNAERYIRRHSNHVIFRLGTLFGISGPFGRIRNDLVTNILTFKACEGRKIQVFGGEQWRPLLSVKDVGRIFAEAVSQDYKGTFILSHSNYKIIDIATSISNLVDGCGEVEITDMKFEDLRNYRASTEKALSAKIIPTISLNEGISEMAEFYMSGRIKDPWLSQYNNAKFIKELE